MRPQAVAASQNPAVQKTAIERYPLIPHETQTCYLLRLFASESSFHSFLSDNKGTST